MQKFKTVDELINKLKGVRHIITKQQPQTPEQQAKEYGSYQTIDDTQAKELAIQLGLASWHINQFNIYYRYYWHLVSSIF